MDLESVILQDARGFTPEKDEQAGDTSSQFLSPWPDIINYFETEDQHAPLAISTPPSPGSDPISPSRTRYVFALLLMVYQLLNFIKATWRNRTQNSRVDFQILKHLLA